MSRVTLDSTSTTLMTEAINWSKKEDASRETNKKRKTASDPPELLYAVQAENKRTPQASKPCFNCGKEGHLARDCRLRNPKNVCGICRGRGHNNKECRRQGKEYKQDHKQSCFNCKRNNHVEEKCRINCGVCGRRGHTRSRCRSNPGNRPQQYRYGNRDREKVNHLQEEEDSPNYSYEGEDSEDTE